MSSLMVAAQHASVPGAANWGIALASGGGVALAGAFWKLVHRLRFGKGESDAIAAKAAQAAAAAAHEIVEDLRKERQEDRATIKAQADTIKHQSERLMEIAAELRDCRDGERRVPTAPPDRGG